jgi:hypothetical protein
LDIPPALLGLSSQQELTSEELGKLVSRHRNQQCWTQQQLGQALDPCLCDASVMLLEKGKGLDSMKRRRALSLILSIPPALLGLAEPIQDAPAPSLLLPNTARGLSGALVEHKTMQEQLFNSYYAGLGKGHLPEVAIQLQTLQQSLGVANRESQRLAIVNMQEIYHIFYVWVGREDCNFKLALSHANQAVNLTQAVLDVTDWRSRERLANAYRWRSEVWRESGFIERAVQDIDKAIYHANGTSNLTICSAFTEGGTVHMLAGPQGKGKAYGQALFEKAGKMVPVDEEDHYYGRFNRAFFNLRRAMAFQNEEAINDARNADTGSVSRRTLILDIEEAKMRLQQRDYEEAARLAVQSLDTARSFHSKINVMRVKGVYEGLKDHMDIPEVARLSLFYLSQ